MLHVSNNNKISTWMKPGDHTEMQSRDQYLRNTWGLSARKTRAVTIQLIQSGECSFSSWK